MSQDNKKDEDIAKLLAIASQPADPKDNVEELNTIQQWIIAKEIKAGHHIITTYELWHSFKSWMKTPDITFYIFCRQIKKHFPPQLIKNRSNAGYYYLVDPTPFDLSLDTHFKIKAEISAARELKRRRRNDKKT